MSTLSAAVADSLVISTDPQFIARAQNWCAAVGSPVVAQGDGFGLRRMWREARSVLIDVDSLDLVLSEALPRRDHVFLIGASDIDSLEAAVTLGVERVIKPDDAAIVSMLSESMDGAGEACVISVVGACGGVGASTLATAIACAAADRSRSVVLVDGDAASGGIEMILGAESEPGLRWPDLQRVTGHVDLAELQAVLPSKHGVDVVSFAREKTEITSVKPVLNTLVRGYDLVVADVPRQLDEIGRQLINQSLMTVVVVPLRLGGVLAAEQLIPRIQQLCGHVLVVAQAVRGGCGVHELTSRLDVRVVGHWPKKHRTFIDVEHGLGPRKGASKRVALTVLETVGLA